MEWFSADGYELARQVVQRGVAAVYVIAFLSTLSQFPALLGERGLTPVPELIARLGGRIGPTIFRKHYSDRGLRMLAGAGAVVAACIVVGLPQLAPSWVTLLAFLAVWGGYLSIVNVGGTFYGFGWESLLLEAGFLAAFLGSSETTPPITVIFLIRWLVFRLEFGAGMIKLRGDRAWRDLSALDFHHQSQPMPNPLSRSFHHLPRWAHRGEVLGNHFAQLVVPFFLFAPQPVAGVAAGIVILTQLWLMLSGNFAWLNALTIILAFAAVSDPVAHAVISAIPAQTATHPPEVWFIMVVLAMTVLLIALAYRPARNLLSRHQLMNASFNAWHLGNAYGAFGSITRERYEVIVEATMADEPDDQAVWLPYEFRGKPGNPRRISGQFAPYHLRLDWLMWFLALGRRDEEWFRMLVTRFLQADPATLRLIANAPFGNDRPRWVRARLYRYRFSTREEYRADRLWWIRTPVGTLLPASCLAQDTSE